jgi:hypothetical protein
MNMIGIRGAILGLGILGASLFNAGWAAAAGEPDETGKCIYYVAGSSIYRLNLDSRTNSVIYSGLPKAENMILDRANQRLLLSLWDSGSSILSYDLTKGQSIEPRYNGPGHNGSQGLAYDAATSNLFMGLYYNGVFVLDQNGMQPWRQIVKASALSPMIGQRGQLVLNPGSRQVYFRSAFNGGNSPCRYIWRVNYDGSGLSKIILANGGDALAIDPAAGHLYFSDEPGHGTVRRSNLDGTGALPLLSLKPPYDTCRFIILDVPAGRMYLYLASGTAWRDRAIARASLDGTGFEILTEVKNVSDGCGLALFIPDPRPKVTVPTKPGLDPQSSPQLMLPTGAIACLAAALILSVLLFFLARLIWRIYRRSSG